MQSKVYYIVEGASEYKRALQYQKIPGDNAASNRNLLYTLQKTAEKYLTPAHREFGFEVLLLDGSEFIHLEADEEVPDKSTIKLAARLLGSLPIQVSQELADTVLPPPVGPDIPVGPSGGTVLIPEGGVLQLTSTPKRVDESAQMILPENTKKGKKKQKKTKSKTKKARKNESSSSEEDVSVSEEETSSEEEEPAKKRRRRVEVNSPSPRVNGKKQKVWPVLNKHSIIIYPELDEELKEDLRTKDIKTDYGLRQKLLPAMVKSYNATLNNNPDNVTDYKYYMKKVVKSLEPLLAARYKNPYKAISDEFSRYKNNIKGRGKYNTKLLCAMLDVPGLDAPSDICKKCRVCQCGAVKYYQCIYEKIKLRLDDYSLGKAGDEDNGFFMNESMQESVKISSQSFQSPPMPGSSFNDSVMDVSVDEKEMGSSAMATNALPQEYNYHYFQKNDDSGVESILAAPKSDLEEIMSQNKTRDYFNTSNQVCYTQETTGTARSTHKWDVTPRKRRTPVKVGTPEAKKAAIMLQTFAAAQRQLDFKHGILENQEDTENTSTSGTSPRVLPAIFYGQSSPAYSTPGSNNGVEEDMVTGEVTPRKLVDSMQTASNIKTSPIKDNTLAATSTTSYTPFAARQKTPPADEDEDDVSTTASLGMSGRDTEDDIDMQEHLNSAADGPTSLSQEYNGGPASQQKTYLTSPPLSKTFSSDAFPPTPLRDNKPKHVPYYDYYWSLKLEERDAFMCEFTDLQEILLHMPQFAYYAEIKKAYYARYPNKTMQKSLAIHHDIMVKCCNNKTYQWMPKTIENNARELSFYINMSLAIEAENPKHYSKNVRKGKIQRPIVIRVDAKNHEEKPKDGNALYMPVLYVYTDKDDNYNYAVMYVGKSQILIPTEELNTATILMLFIQAHHVFQIGYTCSNEVLALIIEMTLGDFTKNETDCKPNAVLEKHISSYSDYRNNAYAPVQKAAIVKRRPLMGACIRSPDCPKKGSTSRRGKKRKSKNKSESAVKDMLE